jgi:hypothetical protein
VFRILLPLLSLPVLLCSPAFPGAYVDWVRPYTGFAAYDYAHAIVADSLGNSFVTGESAGVYPAEDDILTIKYDRDGKVVWTARYDGPASDYDIGWDIALDGAGNVYVAGKSTGIGTGDDFTVVKYAPNGTFLWDYRYTTSGSISHDRATQLTVDAAGNAYVSGTFFESSTGYDAVLVKLNPSGGRDWIHRLDSGANGDRGVKALIAPDGNIRFLAEYGSDLYLGNLTPLGTVVWEVNSSLGGSDIDLDGQSNAYVTGSFLGSFFDWSTLKVNPAGVIEWSDIYDGPGSDFDVPEAISVSPGGEVYVTGLATGLTSMRDFAIIKYSTAGVREWVSLFNGQGNDNDKGVDVSWHPAGGCVATGMADSGWSNLDDVITIKVDGNGAREWIESWDDGYGLNNEVEALVLDSDNNVVITGRDPYNYFTIKYRLDHSTDVEVLITPETQPLVIPSSGGSFSFDAELRNNVAQQKVIDAGIFVVFPNSTLYGPLNYYSSITLPPGTTYEFQNLTQAVPAMLPAGDYTFKAIIGTGGGFTDRSQFFFTKTP